VELIAKLESLKKESGQLKEEVVRQQERASQAERQLGEVQEQLRGLGVSSMEDVQKLEEEANHLTTEAESAIIEVRGKMAEITGG
jgi:uncharacterized coiled-coil DUF342 family protein